MTALFGLALGLVVASAWFGDAAAASAIAGVFSVVNTALSAWLLRRLGHTRVEVNLAAVAAASAAQAAADAARVAKSIGGAIRHEDPLVVVARELPPDTPS